MATSPWTTWVTRSSSKGLTQIVCWLAARMRRHDRPFIVPLQRGTSSGCYILLNQPPCTNMDRNIIWICGIPGNDRPFWYVVLIRYFILNICTDKEKIQRWTVHKLITLVRMRAVRKRECNYHIEWRMWTRFFVLTRLG